MESTDEDKMLIHFFLGINFVLILISAFLDLTGKNLDWMFEVQSPPRKLTIEEKRSNLRQEIITKIRTPYRKRIPKLNLKHSRYRL